jgi:acetylornithine deacetylase/succinyl-diaminopimelate desuccinylase-like protein
MQKNLEATLEKLVSIPSTSDNSAACHEIIDFVRGELEPLGLYVTSDTDRPNPWFIATTKDTKTPDILLAAHLDVVPGPIESFTMQKRNGKLFGRGVYDMKFAAACYIEFAKTHADILHTLDIGFYFSTDEEIGGPTVPLMLDMGWRPRRVFLPDGGEDWKIEERAKGFYGMDLAATGVTAHGSRPWEGDNAIHKLLDIAQTLRGEYPPKGKDDATLAVTVMHGGTAINQVPSDATMRLDFRCFDKDELIEFKSRVEQLASERDVTVTIPQWGYPVLFDKQSNHVQDFLRILPDFVDSIEYVSSYGGSDARFFAQRDIPTIIIEPHGDGRHAPDEWIEADDLEKYYRLMERWLIQG